MSSKFSAALHSRKSKGLNSIILVMGARGIGKSYLSLKIGETYDHNFNVNNVIFTMEEFLTRLNEVKKYAWLVFDETGLEVAAREFMTIINKVMSYIAQSFRYTAVNLICVVPNPDMVDIHIRELADFWIVVTNRGHARVYRTRMNPFRSGSLSTPLLCKLNITLPSQPLCDEYESKRRMVLDSKYTIYLQEILKQKGKGIEPVNKRLEAIKLLEEAKQLGYTKASEVDAFIADRLTISETAARHYRNLGKLPLLEKLIT